MHSLDLASLREAYRSGEVTPAGIVEDVYRRITAHADPAVWIHLLPMTEALAFARRLEGRDPATLPLYGVPFAIKDNIDLAGVPTTAACPEFGYVPRESATVVQRLIAAGAIPIGKTNLDQFATGLVGVRSPYGVPKNPFHAEAIPGGSSSGSAVAVAAGLVSFALGTDTAGSGRVPAGLNNIVGLKPTRGAVSTRGVVPACRTLDCVSVFALTCDDAAAVLAVAESFDPDDPFSRPRPADGRGPTTPARSGPSAPMAALRIGVPAPAQLTFGGDAGEERRFHDDVEQARALGATVVEIDFTPFRETAALLYQGPWVAERWAALRHFHHDHASAFLPVTRRIVEAARDLSAADAFAGLYRLAGLSRQSQAEWEKMDVLLVPTAPRPFTVAEIVAEPVAHNALLGTYTNFVNLLDLAAIAVPAGLRRDGIPRGLTFIAPAWSDAQLLELGATWHAHNGGTLGATSAAVPARQRPATATSAEPRVRLAVVGAHLTGLPLNGQLTALGATLAWTGTTAPVYRLFALPGTTPPKPGLQRVRESGAEIAVEVWELTTGAFGQFVSAIPAPLCIGSVRLGNGDTVKGFLCEPAALEGARDITSYGGWRAYLETKP